MKQASAHRAVQGGIHGLIVVLLLLLGSRADAQATRLNQYREAPVASDGFVVSRATDQGHMQWGGQLHLDYGFEPLVLEGDPGEPDSIVARVVEHHLVSHLSGSLGLHDRYVIFAGYYANLIESGQSAGLVPPADGLSSGDFWLGGRARILGDARAPFALAGELTFSVPFAQLTDGSLRYAGEEMGSIEPEVVATLRIDGVEINGNLGMRFRQAAPATGVTIDDELTYAVGAQTFVAERVRGHLELWGASTVEDFGDRESSPLELLLGSKWLPCDDLRGWVFGGSVSTGLLSGFGTPLVRVVGMAGYGAPEGCPEPEPEPEPLDSDGDGLIDPLDRCPLQPEDVDQFEDEDGCPDPDNDQDGVLDVDDQCVMDPEDIDQFEDADGCPDPDNDQDTILDTADQCPLQPEDADGFEDENGCPDPDNDQDTVLDVDDECPLTPGAVDAKGCPKTIRVEEGQIVILERVEFATNKDRILERSEPILEEVRATLGAQTKIKRLRVEGHTDSRGRDAKNLDLSRRRARSVMRWLVEHGVAAERLEAWGCGENLPIGTNDTKEGRQANRRVEFHILEPAPEAGPRNPEGCEPIDL